MNTPRPLPLTQQLLSLGLAALVTTTLLLSLGAQADLQHADVVLAQTGSATQAVAASAVSRRS